MKRRGFFQRSGVMVSLAAIGGLPALGRAQTASNWNKPLFESKSLADALKILGATPLASPEVQMSVTDLAENGGRVDVVMACANSAVTQMVLLADKNPSVVAAVIDVPSGTEANFELQLKLAQSSQVIALALVGNRWLMASKTVSVTLGGCSSAGEDEAMSPAPQPARAKAQLLRGKSVIRMLVKHTMESGQRRTAAGKVIPAWFVQTVKAEHAAKVVFNAALGTAVSKDPVFGFSFKDGKTGEKLKVSWADSRGAGRSDELVIG